MFTSSSTGIYALGDSSATLINDWLTEAHRKRLLRKDRETQARAQRRASDASLEAAGNDDEERERRERSDAKGQAAERAKKRLEKEIIDLTTSDDEGEAEGVAVPDAPVPSHQA